MTSRRPLFRFPWRTRRQIARDLDAELGFHIDMRVAELTASGVALADARRQAVAEFGDLEQTRDYCRTLDADTERDVRTSERLDEWRQDIRFAWRTVRRSPSFAIISLLTLGAAIGANTAIFTVTRAVLLAPLPYGSPGSLVAVYERPRGTAARGNPLSVPDFVDYRASQRSLSGMAAYSDRSVTWRPAAGDPQLVNATSVTDNMFDLLDVRPALGRAFNASDDPTNTRVILSYAFWSTAFGADSSIIGRPITLNDLPYVVIGVMPRGFTLTGTESMWTILDLNRELTDAPVTRKQHYLRVIARLAPGVTLGLATADLESISRRLQAQYPDANPDRLANLVSLHQDVVGDVRPALLLLQCAAALVLVIACVNLANLTLSRTMGRRQELALRAALGAGRGRLARQILTESVVLAAVGGALGTAIAAIATRLLIGLDPTAVPPFFDVRPDASVVGFGMLLSLITGALFGLLPALDAARADLHGTLKEGGRGASGTRGSSGVHRALVVAQVGLAVLLLVGAGLLVRSFAELTRVRVGFRSDHVLTAEIRVSGERYDSTVLVNRFYDRVLGDVRNTPGVRRVGGTMKLPMDGRPLSTITVEGQPVDRQRQAEVAYNLVRGDYFEALGIPLVTGRVFTEQDRENGAGVVLVNQTAARTYFADGHVVGRRVHLGPDPRSPMATVIGVVGDTRDEGFDVPPRPAVYASHVQNTWWRSLVVVVRVSGNPRAAEAALRRAVRSADPALALRNVRTLDDVLGERLAPRRFAMSLVSGFAALALLLAAVGIYGVLAFSVARRTREFGVRLALGATKPNLLGLVIRQGMAWSAIGLALGVAGALAAGRLLEGMLYGVRPADPIALGLVTAGLFVVAAVACVVPAVRAARVDPMTSIRAE
jgi:predicted permease